MNKSYKEYLKANNIISEEEFMEVMEWLPDVDINLDKVGWGDLWQNKSSLANDVMNEILLKWEYAYVEEIDWDSKSFVLGDVRYLDDLKEIKELFSKWTISNYNSLEEDLLEEQREEQENFLKTKKYNLLNKLGNLIDIDEIQFLIKKYDNKK